MYRVRPATIADLDVLIHHRIAMFRDMHVALDADALSAAFREWLHQWMPAGAYRAWLVECDGSGVVAGGGMTILPLARRVMDAIHDCCRAEGIALVALQASRDGMPMYESMGYVSAPNPMMFFPVVNV